VLPLRAPAELCVFSDGVFDVRRPGGSRWSFDGFVEFLKSGAAGEPLDLDAVHRHVLAISDGRPLADDFSILRLCVGC
jgi:serine phosphatase RsbU (regulator of sigma subunit)